MSLVKDKIQEAVAKYHWIEYDEATDEINMYIDHHALSTFRQCEAHFVELIMNSLAPKGAGLAGQPPWSLQFGACLHKAVEYLYQSKAMSRFNQAEMIDITVSLWNKFNLDIYSDHKTYKALGGLQGFLALLTQYSFYYSGETERLRPIATEVPFGKNKEVHLGRTIVVVDDPIHEVFINCYLTGRIDFLMDSGRHIGPMDHKTRAIFRENPILEYEQQEGMTGYIYASQKIIQDHFPDLMKTRSLDRMWMNFIQVKSEPDSNKRFRRLPIFKTPTQIEDYKLRQLRTFKKIFEIAVLGEKPDWNTNACMRWYFSECMFRKIHKQNNEATMQMIRETDFKIIGQWNPEDTED